ncbi:hypothetical protein ACHAW6_008667 [Cyclotella cf. meneghiniana]
MDGVDQAVSDAVGAMVEAEGGVNISILKSTLQEIKDEMFGKIENTVRVASLLEFHYKGTNWPIPESFQSPKETKRLQGWRKWLKGSLIVVES